MKHLKFFVFLCILTFTISCGQQKKYIQYKVKEGETLKTIAKRLDVKTKDLVRLNPDVGRNPEVNSLIIIPNTGKTVSKKEVTKKTTDKEVKVDTVSKDFIKDVSKQKLDSLSLNFIIHDVKAKETIYGLTRFYNVTEQDLLTLNPVLSEGLKIGQILKIRPIIKGETSKEKTVYEDVVTADVSLKATLMLPFITEENDSIKANELFDDSRLANIVTDFYLGAMIAVDSLRKQGVTIDVNVFDTQKNSTKIKEIIRENNLEESDVIIGPLYSEEASYIAKQVNAPVIYPMYSKSQSKFTSSNLIKTSPEKNIFRQALATFISDTFTNGTIMLVGDNKSTSNTANISLKNALELHDSINNVRVLKPKNGYIDKNRFLEILKPNQENWVVLTSDDTVLVADIINSFISLPEDTTVRVFTYNKEKAFDKISNLKLAKVNLTYVSDEYVNEESITTKLFNSQYFKKNNALPSFQATKGFDITYDVLMRLASGNSLEDTFKEGASYRVESKFDYYKNKSDVIENKGLFILKYNKDLSLTRLK
ncbi:LysM peptidoglycan-binding domain-containing protein [uncultured Polaribacter sp.]|uniref:amino acid ABC transporter substrate-binding protein n=1 Tax=uncultured Polaribacter sp. TaxID=174711 RepID=UPI00261ECEB6|nr:LysM peptidoglycan-binding domain-containing protein [uncultured Polaribacter sp.]